MAKRSTLNYEETAAKYPHFPKLVMLKIDVHRRGVYYTPQALSTLDETRHHIVGSDIFGTRDGKLQKRPEALTLRDGNSIVCQPTPLEKNPYIVDLINGKLILTDQGKELEEVYYWEKPDFFDQQTTSGVSMRNIVNVRPQRLYIIPNRYCHFWSDNQGCKFCDIVNHLKRQKDEVAMQTRIQPKDVAETVKEALKEKGRYSAICLTAGSDFHGEKPFDKEVDYYIEILQAIGENFATKKFPSQLICTAITKDQLKKLYDQTGLLSITFDTEVLNERIFNEVCPGKAKWVGYKEWKKRLIDAVDIFGANRVSTGIVSGVELADPSWFDDEDLALESTLKEADELASFGVSTVNMVWIPRPNTYLADRQNASLEYYVRLAYGLQAVRRKHNLEIDFDDYRRCGNHPDTDLARVF